MGSPYHGLLAASYGNPLWRSLGIEVWLCIVDCTGQEDDNTRHRPALQYNIQKSLSIDFGSHRDELVWIQEPRPSFSYRCDYNVYQCITILLDLKARVNLYILPFQSVIVHNVRAKIQSQASRSPIQSNPIQSNPAKSSSDMSRQTASSPLNSPICETNPDLSWPYP
jgi:hypothetical protein